MLCAPSIVAPATPWTRKVRVKNQLAGATVSVSADGSEVGRAQLDGPDGFVALNSGVTLSPGQQLSARQELNGEKSVSTPPSSTVVVLNAPTATVLGGIHSRAPLYQCGRCLWIEGIVPGADVEVDDGLVQTLSADWTAVHADVSPLGDTQVSVRQRSGSVIGPWTNLSKPLRQKDEVGQQQIFAPSVEPPLHACQRAIEVREVMPGAQVSVSVIDRSGLTVQSSEFCLGSTKGLLWLSDPLEMTQRVALMQEYPDCLPPSQWADYPVTVWVPTAPIFLHPVCAGDREVELGGVETGAAIEFIAGGKHFGAHAGEPPHRFIIPPIGNVSRLGVRQSVCDTGPWSDIRWIDLIPMGTADHPIIVEPIHSCGLAVAVEGASDGTQVRIVSQNWGGSIGEAVGNGDRFLDIPMIFALIDGDVLHVEVIQCGLLRALTETATVVTAPRRLPAPTLDNPLDDIGGTVIVWDSVPGAMIDLELVESDQAYAGTLLCSRVATRENAIIQVPPIPPKPLVRASQRLCSTRSALSSAVQTGDRLGRYVQSSAMRLSQISGSRGNAGKPPRTDPLTLGIIGTDLGIPVEHKGRLYFFFGDCDPFYLWGLNADADPIAWTTDGPNEPGGPVLHWLPAAFPFTFRRLHVEGFDPLGNFEVPTGAFSYGGRLYLFVGRDVATPTPGETDFCSDGKYRMQMSQLAVTSPPSEDPRDGFEHLYDVAKVKGPFQNAGRWLVHVSPTVVRNADWPGLPAATGDGLVMFEGAPADGVDPENWRRADRLPAAPPPSKLLLPPNNRDDLGELSVVYDPVAQRWVMSYMTGARIIVRTARLPWGPWLKEIPIFDGGKPNMAADNLPGPKFVGLPIDEQFQNNGPRNTVPYAPYLIQPWFRFDRSTRQLTLHYTMSVEHPPYNVQLMRSAVMFTV